MLNRTPSGTRRIAAIAALLLWLVGVSASGQEPAAEFPIGKGGRYILLPLKLKDREILGLLDTGASASAFDTSLTALLGKKRGTKTSHTPAGEMAVETFDWPEVWLGSEKLSTDEPVGTIDLGQLRKVSGTEFFAVLGMDVLRHRRIEIDFDSGVLRLLDPHAELPDEPGERRDIVFGNGGTPHIRGSVHVPRDELFLIDTGASEASLAAELFDQLVEQQRIRKGRSSLSATANGALTASAGWLDKLSVGPFEHGNLRVARLGVSSVGLKYLSRYRVTFDFPEKCVYLKPGDLFSRPEPNATSGLSLAWVDREIVVVGVLRGGPADRGGIRPNDVLLEVDGKAASDYDHLALKNLLTSEIGRSVPLTVRRRTRDVDVSIVLDAN